MLGLCPSTQPNSCPKKKRLKAYFVLQHYTNEVIGDGELTQFLRIVEGLRTKTVDALKQSQEGGVARH